MLPAKEDFIKTIKATNELDGHIGTIFSLYVPNDTSISITKKYYNKKRTEYAVFTYKIINGRQKRLSRICEVSNGEIRWTKSGECLLELFELNDKYLLSPIPED